MPPEAVRYGYRHRPGADPGTVGTTFVARDLPHGFDEDSRGPSTATGSASM